jgi:hypothetical protein
MHVLALFARPIVVSDAGCQLAGIVADECVFREVVEESAMVFDISGVAQD